MSDPTGTRLVYSGFSGMADSADKADTAHPLFAFNVDFESGIAKRRPGRQKLLDTNFVRPSKVIYYNSGATPTYVDYTSTMTDGDTATGTGFFLSPTAPIAILYLGFPFRVPGIKFYITSPTALGTLAFGVYQGQGAGSGFNAVTFTDGTVVAGNTLRQTGLVQFAIGGNDWNRWSPGADTVNSEALSSDLFWIQVYLPTASTATVSEVSGYLVDSTAAPARGEATGLSAFASRMGNRLIVASSVFPGTYDNTFFATMAEERILIYDLYRGDASPVRLPAYMKTSVSGVTTPTSMVTFNGWLLGSTSSGYLWKYNGKDSGALEALAGLDLVNGVIGAQGYLPQTPKGTILNVYHEKLMVTGDPEYPLTFYASLEDNNVSVIPANATVGGPNIWPTRYVYNIPSQEGEKITAASVINDRYIVFTRNQTWAFDETSLRAINLDVGCVAQGSVQRIDNHLFFLSDQGVMRSDGVNLTSISVGLFAALRNVINWSAIATARSVHDKTRAEYHLWLPINGEYGNQMEVVYSYARNNWRVAGGWYPFDTDARRDANGVTMSITAAAQVIGTRGLAIPVSVDSSGALWQESVGYDDNGLVFPAYMVFGPVGNEEYLGVRSCYLGVTMDGGWWETMMLPDGERFDQELDRRFANVATVSLVDQKQALVQNSVAASVTESTYGAAPAWPVTPNQAQFKKLKMSHGQNLTKFQPIIHLPGGQYSAGSYINKVAAPMQLSDFQITVASKPTGR